jgi:lipopolysaccharide/colanic/teichoic acid biosynthesis glycosyltransferase
MPQWRGSPSRSQAKVPMGNLMLALKRFFDITIAATVLLVSAPLTCLIALLIAIDDGWPVLFVQERVGRGGRKFRCIKFRTMKIGTGDQGGALNVSADDARLTRVGRRLRDWTLDEIPQLINVVTGEMSIVGPRPWVEEQAAYCSATEKRRFDVRPGMAGWAWIHGRNHLPFEERIRLDIWYVDHWSLWLDLRILAKAFVLLFRRVGVYLPAASYEHAAKATLSNESHSPS